MPTEYNKATETMVLDAFRIKIDQEEGIASFQRTESPDGIIHTQKGHVIGVEVTSAIRTDDFAETPNDKNKVAIFLNKFGLQDPSAPPYSALSESFKGDSCMQNLLAKIRERIQEKEANEGYRDFKTRFNKSVLTIYLDDQYVDSAVLERITSQNTFSCPLQIFDEVFLYIRSTYHTSPSGLKHIGGFYLIGQKNHPAKKK